MKRVLVDCGFSKRIHFILATVFFTFGIYSLSGCLGNHPIVSVSAKNNLIEIKNSFIEPNHLLLNENPPEAKTTLYRAVWTNDPHSSITLAWNSYSKPEEHTLHYGTQDQGRNYESYEFSQKPDQVHNFKKNE